MNYELFARRVTFFDSRECCFGGGTFFGLQHVGMKAAYNSTHQLATL
jgi:hypothetical protein